LVELRGVMNGQIRNLNLGSLEEIS
jgi:hypothetical protein